MTKDTRTSPGRKRGPIGGKRVGNDRPDLYSLPHMPRLLCRSISLPGPSTRRCDCALSPIRGSSMATIGTIRKANDLWGRGSRNDGINSAITAAAL